MDNENNIFEQYAELIKRWKSGDGDAFTEIYEKSQRLVYTTCLGILNNEQDAEEATQDTYLKVYENIASLADEKSFIPWLKRIAASRALDKCRARKDEASYEDAVSADENLEYDDNLDNLPEALVIEKDKRDTFHKIIRDSLSDDQYRTTLLFYYDDMPVADIAKIMNCPENTVKTKLRLARAKIKAGVEAFESANKISLMGGAAGTQSLGKFFSEFYGSAKIPALKALPFEVAGSKGAAAGTKVATKAAGKAASAGAKGSFLSSPLAKIGIGVAAIAVLAVPAVIAINNIKDSIENHKPKVTETEESETEETTLETTETEPTETTETDPSDTHLTMEEAYLEVLYEYGDRIINEEQTSIYGTSQEPSSVINYLDINSDGLNELIFHVENRLYIYGYDEEKGEARQMLDRKLVEADYPQFCGMEAVVLDNNNVLIATYDTWKSNYNEYMTEIQFDGFVGKEINKWYFKGFYGSLQNKDYSTATLNNQSISIDEYFNAYEDYRSRVVLSLMHTVAYTSEDKTLGKRGEDLAPETIDNLGNYYFLDNFLETFGGNSQDIGSNRDWAEPYLEKVNSITLADFADDNGNVPDSGKFTFDLVYINSDDVPELLVCLTRHVNNAEYAGNVTYANLYTFTNGNVLELGHNMCVGTSIITQYRPKNNTIHRTTYEYQNGVRYTTVINMNYECTYLESAKYIDSCVDLELYPDYWSGEDTTYQGYYTYHFEYDAKSDSLIRLTKSAAELKVGFYDDYEDLIATKSLSEIQVELSK